MVNRAFRLQDMHLIIRMGFFLQDLHHQIQNMYKLPSEKLTLYRGQGLSYAHFQQLRTMQGGLFSFNSFLSTTIYEEVAMSYAGSSRHDPDLIGIIFKIHVDPTTLTSTQLVSLDDVSYFLHSQGEFLFTMHTVFGIGEIKCLEDDLWQVELSLRNDDDKDLKQLTEYIQEVTQGSTGWDRLGKLLIEIGALDKAEEVFEILIENSATDDVKGRVHRYHLMGLVKTSKGDYTDALILYKKALQLDQVSNDSNDIDLATLYNDIGSLYQYIEEYENALQFYQMARDIHDASNPSHYSNLVTIYGYIAGVNKITKQYSKALQCYQSILKIQKKSVLSNYSNLASTYKNMAEMCYYLEEYPEALKLFQNAFNIQQDCFPRNYIEMATIENNVGQVYEQIEAQSKAIEHYENALKHCQTLLDNLHWSSTQNASDLAIVYSSFAQTHMLRKNYFEALDFYKETLRILNKFPDMKKPDVAIIYDNVGQMCERYDYMTGKLCYQQAIVIAKQSIPPNPSQLRLYRTHFTEVSKKL